MSLLHLKFGHFAQSLYVANGLDPALPVAFLLDSKGNG